MEQPASLTDDHLTETTISLAVAYGAFLAADRLGGSGVKVRALDIELNPANPNLLYALSLRQRWLTD